MANLTIQQAPEEFTPAYEDIIYVVSGINNAQDNFKFIADVIVNGESTRLAVFPDPTYGTAVFNFKDILQNYVTSDIDTTTYGFQECANSIKEYTVQFGEEYGTDSSGTTVYANQITSTKYAYNGIIDFLPFQSYDYTTKVMASGSSADFLTNAPSSGVIRDNENAWLHGMTESSGAIYHAKVITYDSAGSILQTVKVNNPFQAVSSVNSRHVRFGCGTSNLNNIPASGITDGGAQPIITAAVTKYDITFQTYAGTEVSNTFTYLVDNACTKNDVYRFHFLNKEGGFDSFSFIRASNKNTNIRRSQFKSKTGGLTSANAYGYNTKDRQRTDYYTELGDTVTVRSDWISEATSEWLGELVESPEVFVEDATYGLVAVNITDTFYRPQQENNNKLFNLSITFRYSYDRFRQGQ
jgi:hypothetical protein